MRKYGIAYKTRVSWRRSLDSSPRWRTSNPVHGEARQGTSKPKDREVREMRTAATILGIIHERCKSHEHEGYVPGEPRAVKAACVVRRGTDEKGHMMHLVSGLPYNILD